MFCPDAFYFFLHGKPETFLPCPVQNLAVIFCKVFCECKGKGAFPGFWRTVNEHVETRMRIPGKFLPGRFKTKRLKIGVGKGFGIHYTGKPAMVHELFYEF